MVKIKAYIQVSSLFLLEPPKNNLLRLLRAKRGISQSMSQGPPPFDTPDEIVENTDDWDPPPRILMFRFESRHLYFNKAPR